MPAGPIGPRWALGSWPDTTWEAYSWYPQQFVVPNVVGLPGSAAVDVITDAGLTPSSSSAYSDTVPVGDVISQNPAAGSSVPGLSVVEFIVSLGPALTEVPDVVGDSQAVATATLEAAGFGVLVQSDYSPTVPIGDVISQFPAGGADAGSGSVVIIVVSLGPAPPSAFNGQGSRYVWLYDYVSVYTLN